MRQVHETFARLYITNVFIKLLLLIYIGSIKYQEFSVIYKQLH